MKKITSENSNAPSTFDDEIDLSSIINFFLRNKLSISILSLFFFLLAIFYSFSLKKIWKGKFQIVLNKAEAPLDKNINPRLENILGISNKDDLKTEVGILESPSVLMPIFDYVSSTEKEYLPSKKIYFSNWKKQLNIQLQRGTSILNISYFDTNKERIIPVLNQITNAYQEYSGRKKKRAIELTKNFLKKQILLTKEKSLNSLKLVQQFAIDQDLIYEDNQEKNTGQNPKGNSSRGGGLLSNISIENIRVKAANEIRRLNLQILKIKEIGNDVEKLQYIGSSIPALVEEGLPLELAVIEKELIEKRARYTDTDKSVLLSKQKKELLIKVIKKRALGYLEAKKLEEEAIMQAAMRPKGVLLKYKELVREADRYELTLIGLENELEAIELEESKLEDPWQLITNPTLLKNDVGPSKLKLGLIGLFGGFIFATALTYLKEKKSGIIFDISELEKLLDLKFIEKVSSLDLKLVSNQVLFLVELINNKLPKKVFLFKIGNDHNTKFNNLIKIISENNKFKKDIQVISTYEKLNQINKEDGLLLISSLGCFSYSDISIFNKFIELNQLNLFGLILLDS